MKTSVPSAAVLSSTGFRPLKWNELVKRGDFVKDARQGFEPWVGPSGFRADAFIKTIYRRSRHQTADAIKSP